MYLLCDIHVLNVFYLKNNEYNNKFHIQNIKILRYMLCLCCKNYKNAFELEDFHCNLEEIYREFHIIFGGRFLFCFFTIIFCWFSDDILLFSVKLFIEGDKIV